MIVVLRVMRVGVTGAIMVLVAISFLPREAAAWPVSLQKFLINLIERRSRQ